MANFRYRGRGSRGDLIEGLIEAGSVDAAALQLANTGVTPVDIKPAATGQSVRNIRPLARRVELTDLILFSRQMYTLLRAGVPLNRALTGLAASTRNPELGDAIRGLRGDIESGRELSVALARFPRIFSSIFVAMVRVGESTGRLDEAMLKLAEYLDLEKDTRARVKSALRYPVFVIVAISVAVAIINIVVIPQFRSIFERAGVALPLPTRILIGTSDLCVAYWPHMLVALIAIAIGVRAYVRTAPGRYQWSKWKLRLPIVGDILFRATLGRFARTFAMSVDAGVPLLQALTVVANAVDNDFVAEHIRTMRTGIERGDTLTRTATATGMFNPLVLQMLAVGEETGSIDTLMAEVAGFYEREVDYDIKNLSQTIEPLLIVVIAGMVLVLALGVFLPMWDLASVKLHS